VGWESIDPASRRLGSEGRAGTDVSQGAIEEMWFEEEGGGTCCRGPGAVTVPGEMGGSRMVAGYRSLKDRSGGQ
jgi:hypothetical protein